MCWADGSTQPASPHTYSDFSRCESGTAPNTTRKPLLHTGFLRSCVWIQLLGTNAHLRQRGHRRDHSQNSAVPFLHWHTQVKGRLGIVRKQAVTDDPSTRDARQSCACVIHGRNFNIYLVAFAVLPLGYGK